MSKNKIPHQILIKESDLNNTNDYPVDNPMNTSNSDEKISIIDEFQLDMNKSRNNCFKNIFACCFPCLSKVDTKSKRVVGFRDKTYNVTNWSNKVENNKYNIILFLPTVIYNQFKQFGNFFYLVMAISQFIPDIKVGFLFAYVSPLCVVVIVSLLKELADDINRRIQDFKTNSTKVTVIQFVKNKKSSSKELKKIKKTYSNLKVGDIIELNKDERIPADIVVLKTYNESEDSNTFIRTDQLDGETDWKLRKAPGITQKLNEYQILTLNGYINYEPPSKFIYNFEGFISVKNDEGNIIKESLGLENTMWESTILATKKIIGIVIYTGKETRARMNSALPKIKLGIVDHELNMVTFYLFCIMLLAAMFLTSLKGYYSRVFFTFFKFIVLFCAIIPIALRVNLVISKTFFSVRINKDKSVPETIARNSTIPEELGRISYIFSDKTGTLTKNEMIFKNIEMETEQFSQESFNDLKDILEDECKTNDAPLLDVYNKLKKEKEINEDNDNDIDDNNLINNNINTNTNKNKNKKDILIDEDSNDSIHDEKKEKKSHNQKKKSKRVRRSRNKIIKDTITSMLLCNNVTPIISNEDPNIISYQASSPDEIALVKFAEKLSMKLIYRTDKQIKIKNTSGTIEEYTILANFPFSSETKRMGIILQNKKYGHIIF